jgi:hypothetical protein
MLGAALVANAQTAAKERGRPIEFSVPKSGEISTNLHELTSKKDSLKQLEEDLYKPLESFRPESSLDGVIVPPPRSPSAPPIQSKRVKELLERRKNWVFMSPEDLVSSPSAEDVLKTPQIGPDGQEKRELPPLVRYYRRLSNKQAELNNPLQFKEKDKDKSEDLFGMPTKSDSRDARVPQEDLMTPSGVRDSAQALNKLVESDRSEGRFSRVAAHGDMSDVFGFGTQPLSKEQMQEHKKFMDNYLSMVDPGWHPPVVVTPENLFSTLTADTASSAAKPAVGLPGALSPAVPSAIEAQMDVTSPRLGPAGLPDLNAHALGQTRAAPVLPMSDPTRVPPAAPTFAVPKRAFY